MKRDFILIALPCVFPSRKERISHTAEQSTKKSFDTTNHTDQMARIDLQGETVG